MFQESLLRFFKEIVVPEKLVVQEKPVKDIWALVPWSEHLCRDRPVTILNMKYFYVQPLISALKDALNLKYWNLEGKKVILESNSYWSCKFLFVIFFAGANLNKKFVLSNRICNVALTVDDEKNKFNNILSIFSWVEPPSTKYGRSYL